MFGGLDDATSLRVGRRWCSPTPPGEDSDKGPAEEVGERTGEEPLSVFCEECEAEMLTEGVDYNFTRFTLPSPGKLAWCNHCKHRVEELEDLE